MQSVRSIFGYHLEEVREVCNTKTQYYYSYPIRKKSGKKRYIDAPQGQLKEIQNTILHSYLYRYGPHAIAYGFAKGKNPIEAAEQHVGAEIVVAMDIKNFFNSIKKEEIYKLLSRRCTDVDEEYMIDAGFSKRRKILGVMTDCLTYKGMLPQGAPTSPALSNIYMLAVDKRLNDVAKRLSATVTRYADDIVFSGKRNTNLPKVIPMTQAILRDVQLYLNYQKIHVMRDHQRMIVNGVVVNEKTNIPRETWRNFRAKLHNLKTSQEPVSQKTAEKMRGQIEWFKSINNTRGEQFLTEFGKLNFSNT